MNVRAWLLVARDPGQRALPGFIPGDRLARDLDVEHCSLAHSSGAAREQIFSSPLVPRDGVAAASANTRQPRRNHRAGTDAFLELDPGLDDPAVLDQGITPFADPPLAQPFRQRR